MDTRGDTPLLAAAKHRQVMACAVLLDAGASPVARDRTFDIPDDDMSQRERGSGCPVLRRTPMFFAQLAAHFFRPLSSFAATQDLELAHPGLRPSTPDNRKH